MHFLVHHHTRYRYDVPVTLGPHTLRLTPQPGRVSLQRHVLRVSPAPLTQQHIRDAYDNQVVALTFGGACEELCIDSELELDTWPAPELPAVPPLPWAADLQLTAAYYGSAPVEPSVGRFAQTLAVAVSYQTLPFLEHLTHTLYTRIERGIRPSGAARTAAETLALGQGACRDLTVLFMEACRSLGLPSRFVSGYQARAETPDGQRHLHAWAEVRLPDGVFHGWDPMHGMRVGEGHVALCSAPEQAGTMPVEGGFSFSGPRVQSTLEYSLHIDTRSR